jgi:hypothetical protein
MRLAARNSGNYALNKNDQATHTPKKPILLYQVLAALSI